jgi:hypothetical protein
MDSGVLYVYLRLFLISSHFWVPVNNYSERVMSFQTYTFESQLKYQLYFL